MLKKLWFAPITVMASSALFGLLWYTVGRGPAILSVAVLLAAAVPVAWFVVRGLDAPEPALVDAGDGQ